MSRTKVLLAAATVLFVIAPIATAADRPNILFLLTDDQRADSLGVNGNRLTQTPNIDRLASDGLLFTNAYIAEPTCKPSRVTYLTGQYERVHNVGFSSRGVLSKKQWKATYPALLREAGYHTGFIGKFGILSYFCKGRADTLFDFWQAHDGWAQFWARASASRDVDCIPYKDCRNQFITPITAECVENFFAQRPKDRPFCLSVSFSAPHGSISGSMLPDESGGKQNRMTRAANSHPELADHPVYGSLYRDHPPAIPEECAGDPSSFMPLDIQPIEQRKACYRYAYYRDRAQEHHVRYAQLVTGIDRAVGRIRRMLEAEGVANNTIIIYSSDHGLLMGEYAIGGKGLLYDLTTQLPFVIYDPRMPESARGRRIDSFVVSTDVAPTIIDSAGVAIPAAIQGKSLRGIIEGKVESVRDDVFLENLYLGRRTPMSECIRTQRWKYIRYWKSPGGNYDEAYLRKTAGEPDYEQLFDLENDPGEYKNLVDDPAHTAILTELRTRCKERSARLMKERAEYQAAIGN